MIVKANLEPTSKRAINKSSLLTASIIIFVILLIAVIVLGYAFSWPWTGFTNYSQIGFRTLWDWMQALLIPLVLAIGVWWLNRSERETEQRIAVDKQRQDTLDTYLDRMTDLLLNHDLRASDKGDVKEVAKARTLTALRNLDGKRKGSLIRFLCEARLVNPSDANAVPVIDLSYADLSNADLSSFVSLHWAKLFRANIRNADMNGANLVEANLNATDLSQANLAGANLSAVKAFEAIMVEVNMQDADLRGADLRDTKLIRANLRRADLRGAQMDNADLRGANLSGAYLDNATLKDAVLIGADLRNSRDRQTSFSGTVLHRANLSRAKLTSSASLKGALLNATIMPGGTTHGKNKV
jgi:uncharacterized protein YjbI with pentapeptide repeats